MKKNRRRFTGNEYQQRQDKVRKSMQIQNIDLLVVYDPANMCWLTGYDGWSFYVPQALVIGLDTTLFIFLRTMDANGARLTTDLADHDIISYPDHYVQSSECHPMEYLADILKNKQLDTVRIGVEKDSHYFSARAAESLYKALPNASFHDATQLIGRRRSVKSEQEITYMQLAGRVVESVYERVLEVAEPGMRKNDLIAEISHAAIKGTAECYGDYTSIVPLIGVGEESKAAHMTWDGEILENNTGMFLELAGAHARYHCPCSRTLYLGTPPQKYREIEKIINECLIITLEAFKPGKTCAEVAGVFYRALQKYGYEKEARYAYPIGLSYPPDWGERTMSIRSDDHTILETNMTFHFMPALWFDDWGFETTESLIVTEQGGQCLSNVPRKLLVK